MNRWEKSQEKKKMYKVKQTCALTVIFIFYVSYTSGRHHNSFKSNGSRGAVDGLGVTANHCTVHIFTSSHCFEWWCLVCVHREDINYWQRIVYVIKLSPARIQIFNTSQANVLKFMYLSTEKTLFSTPLCAFITHISSYLLDCEKPTCQPVLSWV